MAPQMGPRAFILFEYFWNYGCDQGFRVEAMGLEPTDLLTARRLTLVWSFRV